MLVAFPWSKGREAGNGNTNNPSLCLTSCDTCGAFGSAVEKPSVVASDETAEYTTQYSSPSPLAGGKTKETDANTHTSTSQTKESTESTFVEEIEVTSPCGDLELILEDATLCLLDRVCCRRTCDDNDSPMEICGGMRRKLRRRRSERVNKQMQSQFCCTVISWGPDDEEDVSLLPDPIIEPNDYDGGLNNEGLNRATESPAPYNNFVSEENLATPKHKNSFRVMNQHVKACAYCGITREEANRRMKICSRCRAVYYCSKSCQSEDWYNTHKLTCIPVAN